eukprot:c17804_g1_i1.p1 GENE.c17804_g1_i1~~c17804_g1_i1.p1  ORF type:complete len:369 (+),score=83.87 c17804_g1_i1:167-1108(+)
MCELVFGEGFETNQEIGDLVGVVEGGDEAWPLMPPSIRKFASRNREKKEASVELRRFIAGIVAHRRAFISQKSSAKTRCVLDELLSLTPTPPDADVIVAVLQLLRCSFLKVANQTASTLAFLAAHPVKQQLLATELQGASEVFQNESFESLNGLAYLSAVIRESVRLAPCIPFLSAKVADIPRELDGICVGKSLRFQTSPLLLHRNQSVWGVDATDWRPERFLTTSQVPPLSDVQNFKLISFGGGKVTCPGVGFANVLLKTIVGCVINKWGLRTEQGSKMHLGMSADWMLGLQQEFSVVLSRRASGGKGASED